MKIKTIDIQAKEWFDRINGNSYFSAIVTINYGMKTEKSFDMPFQYGYGEHYQDAAFQELQKLGHIPKQKPMASRYQYFQDNKIIVRYNKKEGCLKRELIK